MLYETRRFSQFTPWQTAATFTAAVVCFLSAVLESAIFVLLMRRPLRLPAALALAAGVVTFAQHPGLDRIRITDLRADLTFLASDALEGRRSLQRGSEAAIQFLAAEFAKAGLKPVAGDSYLQPVPLIEYRMDTSASGVAIEHGGERRELQYNVDFFGGSAFEAAVSGPVAFAGYGITAPEFGYDDYASLDARGKVVLVFDHEPQENDPASIFNGQGNTRHASAHVKLLNAKRHGAIGVLFAAEPNRKHPSNQERSARIPGSALRARRLPPQVLADTEARLPAFSVSDQVTAELLAPMGKKPSELQAAIDESLKPASQVLADTRAELRVVLEERRRGTSYNVLGLVEGSDPVLANETVVFSAHYDHDGAWDGEIFHGADDNGSGSVGVIELARAFAASPVKPKRALLFAIFAAEERGLLGSYYYAAHPLRPLETTRAVINFDMIGRNETPSRQTDGLIEIAPDTSSELNLIGTINSPDYRAAAERANEHVGLRLNYKWDSDAALNIFQRSDQFPFALHDIPAVWWFTGFHPDYHQTTDTVEKINFAKMEKILRLAYLTGEEFANAPAPPRFVARPAVMPDTALNYDHMAERIVAALQPSTGERVMFGGDPDYFQELMGPLRARLAGAGAVEVRDLDTAGIYLWLPLSKREISLEERAALAAWLDRGGTHREIHFHWAEGSVDPDGLHGEHAAALDHLYESALDVDYNALSAAQDRAIKLLRSGVVRVRTPAGTDISFRTGARPFNKQDGDASARRAHAARVRVDREIELPAGVLRVAPIEESVNGRIVIPRARFPKGVARNVLLEIRHGEVTLVSADAYLDAVEAALAAGGAAARRFREFALGFNPKLAAAPDGTTLPYYGYGAGVVRMSLGDNTELGGGVRGGFVRWFFFPDATVDVNGRTLTNGGKLLGADQPASPSH